MFQYLKGNLFTNRANSANFKLQKSKIIILVNKQNKHNKILDSLQALEKTFIYKMLCTFLHKSNEASYILCSLFNQGITNTSRIS